jgi:hypothetical protein
MRTHTERLSETTTYTHNCSNDFLQNTKLNTETKLSAAAYIKTKVEKFQASILQFVLNTTTTGNLVYLQEAIFDFYFKQFVILKL